MKYTEFNRLYSYLAYKSYYLSPTQTQLYKSIHAILFFYYKVDYIHHYLLYHKDELILKNSIIRVTSFLIKIMLPICTSMHGNILKTLTTNLSCKFFYLPLIQIQLHTSIHDLPSSCYKFDYNRRYLLRHTDGLKFENED